MSIGKIVSVSLTGAQSLALQWDDGTRAQVDLSGIIAGHPGLNRLREHAVFAEAAVSADGWSIEWPEGADFGTAQLRRWADEQAGETMPVADFRRWLEAHSLTFDSAAAALGLSRRTIAYYMSGEQPIPKTVMLATLGYERMKAA